MKLYELQTKVCEAGLGVLEATMDGNVPSHAEIVLRNAEGPNVLLRVSTEFIAEEDKNQLKLELETNENDTTEASNAS